MNDFQDAFISYGRIDSKTFAIRLHQTLTEYGVKVWFDQNDIPLGVDYQNQIDDGIEKTHNFLFIISPHAINSPYCHAEIELALRRHKRIVPLLHVEQISQEIWQHRNPGRALADWETYQAKGLHSSFVNMHPAIAKINWIYFRDGVDNFETALQGLLELLNRQKDYVYQHTALLAKALEWERHQKQTRYLLAGEERLQAEAWLKYRFQTEQPPCTPTDVHCEFICESIKNANNLMTQVFICSAEQDGAIADQISKTLMREGFTVWIDRTDIQTGEERQVAMQQGIAGADNVIYLLSPASLSTPTCQQVLEYAFTSHKRVIPLQVASLQSTQVRRTNQALSAIYQRLGENDPPSISLPSRLQTIQFIDLIQYQDETCYRDGIDRLLKHLNEDAIYYEQHKFLLVRALKWQQQNRNPSILLRSYNLRRAEAWLQVSRGQSPYSATALQEEFITASLSQPPQVSSAVFLCYSPVNSDFVRRLNDALESHGKATWFDQETIMTDRSNVLDDIHREIENSDHLLFILSSSAIASQECQQALNHAIHLNKRIIVIHYREVAAERIPASLRQYQWVDFRNQDGFHAHFGELMRVLDTNPDQVRTHTRLLLRAMEWQESGRDDSFLLYGNDLDRCQAWLQQAVQQPPLPTELQIEYITASRQRLLRRVRWRTVVFTSVVATLLVAIARFLGLTQPVELAAYDHLLRLRPNEPQDDRLLVIAVDNRAIQLLNTHYKPGRGTLPDAALSDLLTRLKPHRPRLIGLDFYRDTPAEPALATVIHQTPNLIGLCKNTYRDRRGDTIPGTAPPPELPGDRIGFSDFVDDAKGGRFVRRHYLMQKPDAELCAPRDAFSLVLARLYLADTTHSFLSPLDKTGYYVRDLQFGQTAIPQLRGDGSGYQDIGDQLKGYQTLLKYRIHDGSPKRGVPVISLADVLNGNLAEEQVRDRVVLIGFDEHTITEADYWNTPYGELSGVLLQAQMTSQIVSAVLNQRSLIWWWPLWGEMNWIIVWSLAAGLTIWRLSRPLVMVLAGGILLIVLYGACILIFVYGSGWVPLIPAAIALTITGSSIAYLSDRLRQL